MQHIVDHRLLGSPSLQACTVASWFRFSGLHIGATETHGRKVFIMATNLTPCHPGDGIEALNRLRGLAEPLLQIDLDRELQQLLMLDCGVLHDVEALEESALLLTISWRREKSASESFSSSQRLLDEEAVSRMDDEGGAPDVASRPEPLLLELSANSGLKGER